MSSSDNLILDAILIGLQMIYYKFKNNRRAKVFRKMASEHQLKFWQKPGEYQGQLDQLKETQTENAYHSSLRRAGSKAKLAARFFGESPLQARLLAFKTNAWRGDWQTNCNIMEGEWKGHSMTTFDTLFFRVQDPPSEGEYTSVFVRCDAEMPKMIISPTGLLAGLKRLDENQFANWGYHKVSFELVDFNKRYRVVSKDEKLAYGFISQNMMEYLMSHKDDKWHIETAPGGIIISTVYTLNPEKVEKAMDFLAGFLDHVDKYLLKP